MISAFGHCPERVVGRPRLGISNIEAGDGERAGPQRDDQVFRNAAPTRGYDEIGAPLHRQNSFALELSRRIRRLWCRQDDEIGLAETGHRAARGRCAIPAGASLTLRLMPSTRIPQFYSPAAGAADPDDNRARVPRGTIGCPSLLHCHRVGSRFVGRSICQPLTSQPLTGGCADDL